MVVMKEVTGVHSFTRASNHHSLLTLSDLTIPHRSSQQCVMEVSRLLRREMESHKVAQSSHLGWQVLCELDKQELAAEEAESSQILPSLDVRAAEKSLMSFQLDMAKTLSYSRGGGS